MPSARGSTSQLSELEATERVLARYSKGTRTTRSASTRATRADAPARGRRRRRTTTAGPGAGERTRAGSGRERRQSDSEHLFAMASDLESVRGLQARLERRRHVPDDRGGSQPVTVLAGVQVGCFELSAKEGIRNVADLKGRTVGLQDWGSTAHVLVALMAANVGLDPAKDIRWVTDPSVKPIEQFVEGKIDAFMGFPPQPQDLRARQIGHVIVNSTVDRPWSQYFCCMAAGNRDYVQKHPVATKRALRAILKATDLCASEPTRVARRIVDGGFTPR